MYYGIETPIKKIPGSEIIFEQPSSLLEGFTLQKSFPRDTFMF